MLTLIDNYDSFTFNLVQFFGDLGADCHVIRNDQSPIDEILAVKPSALIISPGPCTPDKAGICLDLIRQAPATLPVFGVCLGHQCIGQAFGGEITRANTIMHGKLSDVHHTGNGLFATLPQPLTATRYHSLVIRPDTLPDCLEVIAHCDDGTVMAVRHKTRPVYGVQFHPESIASQKGHQVLANFLSIAELPVNPVPEANPVLKNRYPTR